MASAVLQGAHEVALLILSHLVAELGKHGIEVLGANGVGLGAWFEVLHSELLLVHESSEPLNRLLLVVRLQRFLQISLFTLKLLN